MLTWSKSDSSSQRFLVQIVCFFVGLNVGGHFLPSCFAWTRCLGPFVHFCAEHVEPGGGGWDFRRVVHELSHNASQSQFIDVRFFFSVSYLETSGCNRLLLFWGNRPEMAVSYKRKRLNWSTETLVINSKELLDNYLSEYNYPHSNFTHKSLLFFGCHFSDKSYLKYIPLSWKFVLTEYQLIIQVSLLLQ
jgi:hypothetical protein